MSPTTASLPQALTVAELLHQLGDIAPERVRIQPPPGTAGEDDLLKVVENEGRPCELIDGTLVEKAMGFGESYLAMELGRLLGNFVYEQDLGIVAGSDATIRFAVGVVRLPDVCFISTERLPGGQVPDEPIPDFPPDLAVEVFSRGNTQKEMHLKRQHYFEAGVREVWILDPQARTITVYSSPATSRVIHEDETLSSAVLPGFSLPLSELFAKFEQSS